MHVCLSIEIISFTGYQISRNMNDLSHPSAYLKTHIPVPFQKLLLDCMKAPGGDALWDRFLNHFRYNAQ